MEERTGAHGKQSGEDMMTTARPAWRSMMARSLSSRSKGGSAVDSMAAKKKKLLSGIFNSKPKRANKSAEELQRDFEVGRTYNQMMSKRHNEANAALSFKIALREDAIKALPLELQGHALQPDENMTPVSRRWATDTPPIPNFDPEAWLAKMSRQGSS